MSEICDFAIELWKKSENVSGRVVVYKQKIFLKYCVKICFVLVFFFFPVICVRVRVLRSVRADWVFKV